MINDLFWHSSGMAKKLIISIYVCGKTAFKKKKGIGLTAVHRKIYQFCNFCGSLFVKMDASLFCVVPDSSAKSHFLLLGEVPSSELARPARGSDGLLGRPHQPFQFAFSSRVPLSVFN